LAILIWLMLAGLSKLFVSGGAIPAALEIIGLFIFVKALIKWGKTKSNKNITINNNKNDKKNI